MSAATAPVRRGPGTASVLVVGLLTAVAVIVLAATVTRFSGLGFAAWPEASQRAAAERVAPPLRLPVAHGITIPPDARRDHHGIGHVRTAGLRGGHR
jgi:hypothetical protein